MNNIVFVGGAGRSGTTYLAHVLSKFGHISTGVESQWLSELILLDLPSSEWVSFTKKHWKVSTSPREVSASQWEQLNRIASDDSIEVFCSQLLSFLAKDETPFIVDHTPSNIANYKILSENFPNAKFLHIIRDGRGVFASLKKVMWGANTPMAAVNYWVKSIANGLLARSLSDKNQYREVFYEKLLEDPNEVKEIVKWLGNDFIKEEELIKKELVINDEQTEVPRHTKNQHALVNKGPQTSRIHAWKNELTSKEIKFFEKHAGTFLNFYGYSLEEEKNVYISRKYRLYMEGKEFLLGSIVNPIKNIFRTRGKHLGA